MTTTTQARTFVFVTNIPDFLLEPLPSSAATATGTHPRANRDPRYERLRAFLAKNTSGVMLAMHLETRGYGLVLYASEQEALAACKTPIVPRQPGHEHPPLSLRILRRERPAPSEAVYTPTLTVEGEVVQKADLADTYGLELVYRGRAVAKWCAHTLAQEDCFFGTSCHRIHKRAYQQTVRKRPRVEVPTMDKMTSMERALVHRITSSLRETEELIVPPTMKVDFSLYVSITRDEAQSLVNGTVVDPNLVRRVEAICGAHGGPYFVRFAFPGGAPWDWSLHDEAEGLPRLRQCAPFPANGAPTPLERDLFCQKLLYYVNQMNRFDTIASAFRAFSTSPKVREALQCHLAEDVSKCYKGGDENTAAGLELCVRPWLFLPTAGVEASALVEDGGERVRGVVQRHGALRLMTSSLFLRRHAMDFARYAVLGSGQDAVAEDCLEAEMRRVESVLKRGVEELRHHVRQRVLRGGQLPATAAWCVQLAVTSSSSRDPGACEDDDAMRCVVLSLKPLQRALEDFAATHAIPPRGEVGGSVDVLWNTTRHMYVPLFSRELLERLKQA